CGYHITDSPRLPFAEERAKRYRGLGRVGSTTNEPSQEPRVLRSRRFGASLGARCWFQLRAPLLRSHDVNGNRMISMYRLPRDGGLFWWWSIAIMLFGSAPLLGQNRSAPPAVTISGEGSETYVLVSGLVGGVAGFRRLEAALVAE